MFLDYKLPERQYDWKNIFGTLTCGKPQSRWHSRDPNTKDTTGQLWSHIDYSNIARATHLGIH